MFGHVEGAPSPVYVLALGDSVGGGSKAEAMEVLLSCPKKAHLKGQPLYGFY